MTLWLRCSFFSYCQWRSVSLLPRNSSTDTRAESKSSPLSTLALNLTGVTAMVFVVTKNIHTLTGICKKACAIMVTVEEGEVNVSWSLSACAFLVWGADMWYVCVVHTWGYAGAHTWGCTESRMSGVFLRHSLSYSPETGSLTEREACGWPISSLNPPGAGLQGCWAMPDFLHGH